MRTNWVPLFDKYAVDLVINGHNHIYERTDPLKGGVRYRARADRCNGDSGDARHDVHHCRRRR